MKPKPQIWYHGTKENFSGPVRPIYLTPSKALASMHGDLVAFKIDPSAKWLDTDEVEYFVPGMDSIGYIDGWAEKLRNRGWDVIWDSADYKRGHQQIYVVNPDVLNVITPTSEHAQLKSLISQLVSETIAEALSFSTPSSPKQEKEMMTLLQMLSKNRALEKGGWRQGAEEALEKAQQGDWSEAMMFLRAYVPSVLKRKSN